MEHKITFDTTVGRDKPHSAAGDPCPFCVPDKLVNILETRGDMIWLMNKYPVFHDTWPTVLVETAEHDADLSTYTREKAREVISFGMEKWLETMRRPEFRSVLYFRNYGTMSGGSQRHPHSQIMGLYRYDYTEDLTPADFAGPLIYETADAALTLSDAPMSTMTEFNVLLKPDGDVTAMADFLQTLAKFVLTDFPIRCTSYNIFFYRFQGNIAAKLFPRHSASPLYVGYRIKSVMDDESRAGMMARLRRAPYFGD